MRSQQFAVLGLLLLPLMGAAAHAKPDLQMNMVAEKEVTVTEAGKKVLKRVPAEKTLPGDVLVYTMSYKNAGDEKAVAVKVDDPLPAGVKYLANSASGANTQISFSADGGASFASPDQVMVEKVKAGKKEKAKAGAVDYTHIRWVITEVLPGQGGQLGFRAVVQ